MEQPIKVLLVDDKEDYCKSLSGVARHKNIQIVYSLDWETGFEILQNDANIEFVILDGKGKVEADQAIEHESFALKAMKDIDVYGSKVNRDIPYCLNTGYIDSFGTFQGNVEIFEKSDDQRDKMFEYIIDRVSNSEFYTLKNKYPNPIMLCTDAYIGSKHFDRIIDIIKDIENPEKIEVAQDMLNPMRKILEALFDKLNEIGLIPDEVRKEEGGINGSSIFLSGLNSNYVCQAELIHPMVAENIYRLLNITQDGSHDKGKKLRADEYLSLSKNHILYKSTVYLLLDILEYMKGFLDDNPHKNLNQEKWELRKLTAPIDSISGKVIEIQDSGWGVFESDDKIKTIKIPDYKMKQHLLELDQPLKVTTKPSPDGTRTYIDEIFTE